MTDRNKIRKIAQKGHMIFKKPSQLFSYEELVDRSLGANTYRAFHRTDKSKKGSKAAFTSIFRSNKSQLISALNEAQTESDIDLFSDDIADLLLEELKKSIRPDQLNSYNKIRKPLDIVFEHMVAMGSDFEEARKKNTEFLFLPLDSQMFRSKFVFLDSEIQRFHLKRNFTFKDIKSKSHYKEVQDFLKQKAKDIGIGSRIYFDLEWNGRYTKNGGFLFALNPPLRSTCPRYR